MECASWHGDCTRIATMKKIAGLDRALSPQARAVLRAFDDAQGRAIGFLLSSGAFPEVTEAGSEKLHDIVHALANRHFDRRRLDRALRSSLRRATGSAESVDRVEAALTAILATETKAAYVFGLAAGLGLGSLGDSLRR